MRQGFSLIELLVVISIIATISSVTVFGIQSVYYQRQLEQAHKQLLASLRLAQSSGLASSQPILICPGISHSKQCGAQEYWQQSWLIIQDSNANRQFDRDEKIIFSNALSSEHISIGLNALGVGDKVIFYTNGRLWPNGNFLICHVKLKNHAAKITLHSSGRIRSEISSNSNDCN